MLKWPYKVILLSINTFDQPPCFLSFQIDWPIERTLEECKGNSTGRSTDQSGKPRKTERPTNHNDAVVGKYSFLLWLVFFSSMRDSRDLNAMVKLHSQGKISISCVSQINLVISMCTIHNLASSSCDSKIAS